MTTYSFDLAPDGSPLTEADLDGVYVYKTNHVETAIAKLTELFRQGPRNQALVQTIAEEVQEAEDAVYQVMLAFLLPTAVDDALDKLGATVKETRQGRTNDDYRAAIRVRSMVNRSNGHIEEMLDISRGLVPSASLTFREVWPATEEFGFSTIGTTTLRTIMSMLRQAKAGGVSLLVTYGVAIGAADGDPLGGTIGAVDGNPLGFTIGGGL